VLKQAFDFKKESVTLRFEADTNKHLMKIGVKQIQVNNYLKTTIFLGTRPRALR
jgi:hypothetical protein